MADESQVVRSVDWKTLFPFTLIFKSFRIAVHPSKLILALAAIVLIYAGGRALDFVWPEKYLAVSNGTTTEIDVYSTPTIIRSVGGIENAIKLADKARLDEIKDWEKRFNVEGKGIGAIKWMIQHTRDDKVAAAKKVYDDTKDKNDAAYHLREETMFSARKEAAASWNEVRRLKKQGLFDAFMEHELKRVNDVMASVRSAEWFQTTGVIGGVRLFLSEGPVWAIRCHPVYFTIFFLYLLAVWAVFGGAIARIAAVHVARDEKISIRQALRFSTSKFLSFFSAPLIPLLIMAVVALLIAVGGAVASVPFVGPVVVGLGFFLFLLGGFLITLVFFGWIGGSGLMYPTVAVEGSDSFDAISRSFSYLYARPWRLTFYSAVALFYGSLCYLFIRFFLYVMLLLTQRVGAAWSFTETATGSKVFEAMYGRPTNTELLSYWPNFFDLGPGQSIGAFFIWLWVSLVVSMLGAFAISFYFSAGTIIYMLLRNDVDATEMDDVYIDQPDEEFMETAPATASTTTVVTSEPTASEQARVDAAPAQPAPDAPSGENPPAPQQ